MLADVSEHDFANVEVSAPNEVVIIAMAVPVHHPLLLGGERRVKNKARGADW